MVARGTRERGQKKTPQGFAAIGCFGGKLLFVALDSQETIAWVFIN